MLCANSRPFFANFWSFCATFRRFYANSRHLYANFRVLQFFVFLFKGRKCAFCLSALPEICRSTFGLHYSMSRQHFVLQQLHSSPSAHSVAEMVLGLSRSSWVLALPCGHLVRFSQLTYLWKQVVRGTWPVNIFVWIVHFSTPPPLRAVDDQKPIFAMLWDTAAREGEGGR